MKVRGSHPQQNKSHFQLFEHWWSQERMSPKYECRYQTDFCTAYHYRSSSDFCQLDLEDNISYFDKNWEYYHKEVHKLWQKLPLKQIIKKGEKIDSTRKNTKPRTIWKMNYLQASNVTKLL
jgi:hypothetical protein